MYGAGAAFFTLEPESAPGPWPPGAGAGARAAQKSGGSATLILSRYVKLSERGSCLYFLMRVPILSWCMSYLRKVHV